MSWQATARMLQIENDDDNYAINDDVIEREEDIDDGNNWDDDNNDDVDHDDLHNQWQKYSHNEIMQHEYSKHLGFGNLIVDSVKWGWLYTF